MGRGSDRKFRVAIQVGTHATTSIATHVSTISLSLVLFAMFNSPGSATLHVVSSGGGRIGVP